MMESRIKTIRINQNNVSLIQEFLQNAGNSLASFRYFSKRSLEVTRFHLVTLIFIEDNCPVAYGHLDKDGETVWLGIAVAERKKGKGLGRKMMERLLHAALENKLKRIHLTVDIDNHYAIRLYEKFGFNKEIEINALSQLMVLKLDATTPVYISTLAFMGKSLEEIVATAIENDFAVEFSSGLTYREDMVSLYTDAPITKIPHNYFPAPKVPFVLNLASSDEQIRIRSIAHCKLGLDLAKTARAPFFSAHAGFCIDPLPDQLGRQLNIAVSIDKARNQECFRKSLEEVLAYADKLNINFLLENNVIAKYNLTADGQNPLLCCTADEMLEVIQAVGHPRLGLLLDTAHLKVSAATLGKDRDSEILRLTSYLHAIHHSDNDGVTDSNEKLDENYWFLKHMGRFRDLFHVVEVKRLKLPEILEQIALISKARHLSFEKLY